MVVEVTAPPEAEDAVVDALLHAGGRAVEQRGPTTVTHLPPPEDPDALVAALRERLARGEHGNLRIDWHWQRHESWDELWKQGLGLRRVTDRIAVLPSWVRTDEELPPVTLVIDPGMAFGTAEHPTTRGCLRLLDRAVRSGDRLLDAGAGSAILSIAAAKLGARSVKAVELDPYACEAALENVRVNDAPQVDVINEAVSMEWLATQAPFHGIVANIQTFVLLPLLPAFRRSLNGGGWLILGGILDGEWPQVQAAAARAGFAAVETDAEDEWRSGWFSSEA